MSFGLLYNATYQEVSELPVIPFSDLFVIIMVIAAGVVVLVAGLLAYIVVRYRRRAGQGVPQQVFGNRNLEITWTVLPALVVVAVFGYTLYTMRSQPTPGAGIPDGRTPDVVAIGHQWWWEFRYPQLGIVTANELHLPVGQQVLVELRAEDVQHDFWIPELGQKMDMYPGKVNHLWLEAGAPGDYQGACAEFCGVQHAWMRILAVAQPQAEFEAWVLEQRTPAEPPAAELAELGRSVFGRYPCGSCHAIAGTRWSGNAGPDLTHFGSRQIISAGVLENTPENLYRYLKNPQEFKPGMYMPNFRLTDLEARALTAYLESLK